MELESYTFVLLRRGHRAETKRGFCVYRTGIDETKRLIENGDPSVRAGRMSVEAMTWLTGKGALG